MKLTVENIVLAMENVNSETKISVYELNGALHEFVGYKDLIQSFDEIISQEVVTFNFKSDNSIQFTVNQ